MNIWTELKWTEPLKRSSPCSNAHQQIRLLSNSQHFNNIHNYTAPHTSRWELKEKKGNKRKRRLNGLEEVPLTWTVVSDVHCRPGHQSVGVSSCRRRPQQSLETGDGRRETGRSQSESCPCRRPETCAGTAPGLLWVDGLPGPGQPARPPRMRHTPDPIRWYLQSLIITRWKTKWRRTRRPGARPTAGRTDRHVDRMVFSMV